MTLVELLEQLLAMGGVAAAIVMIVNALGFLGLFSKDGAKGKANTALQLVALIGLWAVKTFFPDLDLMLINEYAQNVAELGVALLGVLVLVLKLTPVAHETLKEAGVPVVGFSQGDETLGTKLGG